MSDRVRSPSADIPPRTAPLVSDAGSGATPGEGQSSGPSTAIDTFPFTLAERYVVQRELGRGGMGQVLLAQDRRLKRNVAIKVLASAAPAQEDLRRLEHEARLVGSLGHPNVVEVHDIGTFEGRPFIVEEFLEGGSLRHRLEAGAMPLAETLGIATQVARGLAAAHLRGVVHCDVKPENVFIASDGHVKILDFGVARLLAGAGEVSSAISQERTSNARAFAGTPAYSSPEQVRCSPVDHRSDIFSAGAVLYEMLAGRRAFQGDTSVEVGLAVLQGSPPSLPGSVPAEIQRIVDRCLDKNPAKRFQSAKDLAGALEEVAARQPQVRRRRWWARPIVSVAGIAAAIAFMILVPRPRPPPPSFRQLTFLPGAVWTARYSHDGREILYTEAFDEGAPRIYSARAENPEYHRLDAQNAVLLGVSSRGDLAVIRKPQFRTFGFSGTLALIPPGGGEPREVAENIDYADWAPDSSSLAIVRRYGGQQRLEYPIGKVLFETTGWLSHPRVSPSGDLVAFLDHPELPVDRGAVKLVDSQGKITTLSDGWQAATGLAWGPGGREVWFSAQAASPPSAAIVLRAVGLDGTQRLLEQTSGDVKLEDVGRDGTAVVTTPRRYMGLAASRGETQRDLSIRDEQILQDLSEDGAQVLFTVNPRSPDGQGLLFVRGIDGSPPLQIGAGFAGTLSPDGRSALIFPWGDSSRAPIVVSIGPGDSRSLDSVHLAVTRAKFFGDGRRVLLIGQEPTRPARLYVLSLDSGAVQPISDEAVEPWRAAISPDGKIVAAMGGGTMMTMYPTAGGVPEVVRQALPGEVPYGWTKDGGLLVGRALEAPIEIYRIDLRAQRRAPWKVIRPTAAGAYALTRIQFAPAMMDVSAYSYVSWKTHLYLVEGLR